MKNIKRALITGVTGQDGAYLSKHLLSMGYQVFGTARRGASEKFSRLEYLGVKDMINIVDFDLLELSNIHKLIEEIKPTEIYNLAAQSFVPTSFDLPILTTDINALGTLRILDAIIAKNKEIKFYQASTSEMFGKVTEVPQKEDTRFYPRSPYGESKLFLHHITINYRESYDIFACSGILFNHESPLRGHEFVTKKITKGLTKIKNSKQECLYLGNLKAKRDWGHASDYVNAMVSILSHKKADDYVVSSGKAHSVQEFVETAASILEINYEWTGEGKNLALVNRDNNKKIVKIDEKLYRPAEVDELIGDSTKIKTNLNWKPKYSFENLVYEMVKFETENELVKF